MTSQHENAAYYRAVEEAFVRRRGAAMLLSPRDWSLIGEWIDVGVPLRVARRRWIRPPPGGRLRHGTSDDWRGVSEPPWQERPRRDETAWSVAWRASRPS